MSYRSEIRRQVVEWLTGARPGLVVDSAAAVKLGQDSFEPVNGVTPTYIAVATTASSPTDPDGFTIIGARPVVHWAQISLNVVIQLFVDGTRKEADDIIDELEEAMWPRLAQEFQGGCFLEFANETTQYPDADATRSVMTRTFTFAVVGEFDKANPDRLQRQA